MRPAERLALTISAPKALLGFLKIRGQKYMVGFSVKTNQKEERVHNSEKTPVWLYYSSTLVHGTSGED